MFVPPKGSSCFGLFLYFLQVGLHLAGLQSFKSLFHCFFLEDCKPGKSNNEEKADAGGPIISYTGFG